MSLNHIFLFFTGIYLSFGQNFIPDSLSSLKYREDQFYIGTNYVIVKSESQLVKQNDFSSQIQFGFLRDFPINSNGKFSVAVGLGSSYTQFKSNINFETGAISSSNFNDVNYISLNLPFEVRWRSSNPFSYNFWRIYLRTQLQYNIFLEKGNALKKITSLTSINLGYNTWNLSLGYDLVERLINSKNNQFSQFKLLTIGLVFYLF